MCPEWGRQVQGAQTCSLHAVVAEGPHRPVTGGVREQGAACRAGYQWPEKTRPMPAQASGAHSDDALGASKWEVI